MFYLIFSNRDQPWYTQNCEYKGFTILYFGRQFFLFFIFYSVFFSFYTKRHLKTNIKNRIQIFFSKLQYSKRKKSLLRKNC